jgi:hypothetical protein
MSRRCPTAREQKMKVVKKMKEVERKHLESARRANEKAKEHAAAALAASHLIGKTLAARKLSAKNL